MWNYNFMLPSLVILMVFVVYFLFMRRLPVRLNSSYFKLLILQLLVMVFDVWSCNADTNYADASREMLYFLNMGFFVFYHWRAWRFFMMTTDILHFKPEYRRWNTYLCSSVFFVAEAVTLLSPITHWVFYIDDTGYHSGPLYGILYVCFLFYIGLSSILLILNRHRLEQGDLLPALGFNVVLLAGNIVRFLFPQYVVMNLFCLVALIIIYLSFENPGMFLVSSRGAFNLYALRTMLNELNHYKEYRLVCVTLKNYADNRDVYGDAQIDQVLSQIGRFLVTAFPQHVVFDLMNGRFVVLCRKEMDVEAVRDTIRQRFASPWKAEQFMIDLTIGLVQMDSAMERDTVDETMNNLFVALDIATKLPGTGEMLVMDEEHMADIERHLVVKRALERALEDNTAEIYLQPLVDATTYQLVGAEVLCRIRDAEGTLVMPDQFIPIAERSGTILWLGEQVLEKACQFIEENDLSAMGMEWINVNLSPIQCLRKDLSDRFEKILSRHNVPASQIHLELTEQSMMDMAMLQAQMGALKDVGFRFVLDDYGTGYSNFARVKRYPFITIKLDMELVWEYFRERDEMLPTTVQIFKQMNYHITAEGVESLEMAKAMRDIGCDYLQGFYFSRPLPVEEFLAKYMPKESA